MRWEPKQSTLLIATLALILLINSAWSAPVTPPAKQWFSDIYIWVGLSIAISASFLGLAYMAGKLFQLNMLDAWVKIEIQELGAAIIIAVFCVAMIATADSAATFLTGQPPGTKVGDAANSAIGMVYNDGQALYLKLSEAYFNIAKVASYSYTAGINLGPVSTSISDSPAAGLYPLVTEVGSAMDSTANLMLFLAAQQSFIIFFVNASLVMLPIGIFMRSFSLTRKVGGVVLAAVIASSVIYPAVFLASQEIYKTYQSDLQFYTSKISVRDPGNPPLASVVCSPAMQSFVESPLGALAAGLGSAFGGGGSQIGGAIGGLATEIAGSQLTGENGWKIIICRLTGLDLIWPACEPTITLIFVLVKSGFGMIMYPFLSSYVGAGPSGIGSGAMAMDYLQPLQLYALPAVSKFTVLVLVFSLIPIIIAMVLLRNLAILFGGEPQLYGISKLV